MSEAFVNIFVGLFYLSGLLVWPIFALLWRKKKRRTIALRWVFFVELLCLVVVYGLAKTRIVKLEHGYYWFILWIPLNLLFTLAGLMAALYDWARSETESEKPPT
jgi:hypothetical protein